MPLPPTSPAGTPTRDEYVVPFAAVGTAGNSLTTDAFVAPRTGYVTAVRVLTATAITGANTNTRSHNVVSPTTRQVTDGVTTNGSPIVTSATAAWTADDVGKAISGTNIPGSTTIASVSSDGVTATLSAAATGTGTTITFTIGSSRTLATLQYNSGVNTTAHVEKDLTLSGTDTKVYKGDLVQFVSTAVGTGITDPGGQVQIEFTAYGEGTD